MPAGPSREVSPSSYQYFDEAYFQDGSKRGTAYINYREQAGRSPTFRELANAISEIFQPRRSLEVGCATGAIVRHLNALGCETHGVDPSEWAVANAEHPNVRLSSADHLPFPDSHFDLVFSCHAIEHLQDEFFAASLAEMTRVTSQYQFHLLPMIGTPPYDGHPDEVRRGLQKDPTHRQLHQRETWIQQFAACGWSEIQTCILLANDTDAIELSRGQFILGRDHVQHFDVLRRARAWNQSVHLKISQRAQASRHRIADASSVRRLAYQDRAWREWDRPLDAEVALDLSDKTLFLVVIVDGASCQLRFAAGQDNDGRTYVSAAEYHVIARPGINTFQFTVGCMQVLRGTPDYSKINHLGFGGENEHATIEFSLCDEDGRCIL